MPIIDAIEALPAPDVLPSDDAIEVTDTAATDTLLLNKKQLCDRLKLNYTNLSKNAGKQNMRADSFMLHTAKQQGEIWEKAELKGFWQLVKTTTP